MYDHLMEKLADELAELDKKVAQGHDLDEKEYLCAKTWAKTIVALQTADAMDAEYEASFRGGRRDSMGRYSRDGYPEGGSYRRYPNYRGSMRRGYSYHGDEEMKSMLQEAYDNAQNEQERKTIRRLMEQMEA